MTPREEVEHLDAAIDALTRRRDRLRDELNRAEYEAGEAELEALVRNHGHNGPVDGCVLCMVNEDLDQPEVPRA